MTSRSPFLAVTVLAGLAIADAALAQEPAPGLRLFGRLGETTTFLMDTSGNAVHTWQSLYTPGAANYLQDDGLLARTIFSGTTQLGVGGDGGGIQRVAMDGTLVWDWRYEGPGFLAHHDIEILPNGNVLMIAWEEKSLAETIAAGRDPALIGDLPFRPDHIIEVQQTGPTTGQIVWEWHVWDHLIQDFDPAQANYGVVADHPELVDVNYPRLSPRAGDWNHMNSVDYDPVHDWIIVSSRSQNEIWIIDHSTTTAQAAGHTGGLRGKGGDLLWRWGNPEAYGRGTALDQQLFGQHSAVFIPPGYRGAGNVLVFNNSATPTSSAVWELTLPLDVLERFRMDANGRYRPTGPVWSYEAPGFFSRFVSSCQRLPNGNTLICSGMQGWIFEVTPAGQMVWQHIAGGTPVFHAHYVDRALWADTDTVSISAGGVVRFDLIAGSGSAAHDYLLIGSVTGTTPGILVDRVLLPLNYDGYFLTTVTAPNVLPLADSAGLLDYAGRARASFGLPPALLPALATGIGFDHSFVTFDRVTGEVDFASNPVHFRLVP